MIIAEEKVKALEALTEQDQCGFWCKSLRNGAKSVLRHLRLHLYGLKHFESVFVEHAWQRLRRVDETPEKEGFQVEILLKEGGLRHKWSSCSI